jgi:hypothetical protein
MCITCARNDTHPQAISLLHQPSDNPLVDLFLQLDAQRSFTSIRALVAGVFIVAAAAVGGAVVEATNFYHGNLQQLCLCAPPRQQQHPYAVGAWQQGRRDRVLLPGCWSGGHA